jgi:predicted  nucleic acid-binding Zn-ribbon protein
MVCARILPECSVVRQDVSKLIKQLKEVEEHMGKLKGASKEVKRLQGCVQEADDEIRELSAQEASLQRQVGSPLKLAGVCAEGAWSFVHSYSASRLTDAYTTCNLMKQLHNASARAAELEARQRLKKEAAEREMERWRTAQNEADKDNMQVSEEVEKLEEAARQMERRIQELHAQEQTEELKFEEEKELVEDKVRAYNRRILNAITNTH